MIDFLSCIVVRVTVGDSYKTKYDSISIINGDESTKSDGVEIICRLFESNSDRSGEMGQ